MKVVGQYDTDGKYNPYAFSTEVVQFGDQLRDKSDGFLLAVKDDYGDWVSPTLMKYGLKSIIKVEE